MAKMVKALQTVAGAYGTKTPDDEAFAVDDKIAKELADKGLVKIVGKAKDEDEPAAKDMSTEKNIIKDKTTKREPQQVLVKEKAETKKSLPTAKKRK